MSAIAKDTGMSLGEIKQSNIEHLDQTAKKHGKKSSNNGNLIFADDQLKGLKNMKKA